MNKGVSIIICTYNGIDKLSNTIAHIAQLNVPKDINWEVILADNGSTDNSAAFAKKEWKKYDLHLINFRILYQAKPGKFYALQSAIKEANYEYLITCDDDNWLASDYITKIYSRLETMPEVGAIGGFGIPVTSGEPLPAWFKDYLPTYAVGAQAKNGGILKICGVLWGAGLSTRKSLYLKMYENFNTLLLQSDKDILFAEDTEYCLRLLLKGYTLYYDQELTYHHFISDPKLTLEYKNKLFNKYNEAHVVLEKYYLAHKLDKKNLSFINRIRLAVITPIRLLFVKNKSKQKTILHHLFPNSVAPDALTFQIEEFKRKQPL